MSIETPELKAARDNMEAAIMNYHRLEAALKGNEHLDGFPDATSLVLTVFENEDRVARRLAVTGDTVGGAHGIEDYAQLYKAEMRELICMAAGVAIGDTWEQIMEKAAEIMVTVQGLHAIASIRESREATHQ